MALLIPPPHAPQAPLPSPRGPGETALEITFTSPPGKLAGAHRFPGGAGLVVGSNGTVKIAEAAVLPRQGKAKVTSRSSDVNPVLQIGRITKAIDST